MWINVNGGRLSDSLLSVEVCALCHINCSSEFPDIQACFLKELSSDSSQHVRSALASVIMGMAPILGKVRNQFTNVYNALHLCCCV